jgi:predicted ATP-grasp superfamily ATP-dependent carboligase
MARIQIGGAGGAPSNNVIRSLREGTRSDHLIGTSCVPTDLFLADVDERHLIPPAVAEDYPERALALLEETRPDLLHVQNDLEVLAVSRMREDVEALGVKLFLPSAQTVEICVDKFRSYEVWSKAGVPVPDSVLLESPDDLEPFFDKHGGELWLRANVGGGGRGALPTRDLEFARRWIDLFEGWGSFMAAEKLSSSTVTWLSVWHEGELVVAQGRRRRSWNFGNRTLSGVTGITGVAETIACPVVDDVAMRAIQAIDPSPHGIFGVDMTYDHEGLPRVTEINIGRFFTTVYFFTAAGLNMPEIYVNLALGGPPSNLPERLNPLPDGLVWVRGMDVHPVLTDIAHLEACDWCSL